ncbi:MAG: collagen-like protein [Candidatus Marinimicrobia bacterium]|nr:collagen-like protein [Candidatus Neomarinimicrobiota bacterium]
MNLINANKSIAFLIVMVLSVVVLMTIPGCEGPKGPAGADGVDGVNGIDGTDGDISGEACLRCHNDDRLLEKRFELNQHDHATMSNSLSRGGRASCGRCHSHENFVSFWVEDTTYDLTSVTGLTCKSCHTLHDTPIVNNFSFATRVDGDIPFLTGGTETFGTSSPSNLCIACHQPRRDYTYYDSTPTDATDDVSITSSHAGPHYGVAGSLIFGKGADDRNGTIALDQGSMAHAFAGCVTCHMGDDRLHTFKPDVDNCVACHSDADDFDMNGIPTKIQNAVHAIELEFVTIGALEDDGEGGFDQTASSSAPTVLSGVEYSAFWNYLVLHSDHGSAYHNPPYVKAIINNVEENLGMTLTTWD